MTTSTMIRAARSNFRVWTWSVFLVLGASLTVASPVVSPDSGEARVANLRRAWEDCTTLVHEKPCAPIIVRLAWHEAGTYDAKLKNMESSVGQQAAQYADMLNRATAADVGRIHAEFD